MDFSEGEVDDIFMAQTQLMIHSDYDRDDFIWMIDVDNEGLLMLEKSDYRTTMNTLVFEKEDRSDFGVPHEPVLLTKPLNKRNTWFFKKDEFNDKLDEFKQNYQIPIQYEQFLIKYNGGILSNSAQSGTYLPALNTYIYPSVLFGLNTLNKMNDLIVINKTFAKYLPSNAIIIGEDLTNGFIVMELNDDNKVYYWDITNYYDYTSLNSNAYLLSESIEDFFKTIKST